MKTINFIITIIILSLALNAQAGTADLELTMDFDLSDYVEFNQVGTFSITLTNNGPDIAGLGSSLSRPLNIHSNPIIPPDLFFILDTDISQVCSSGYLILEPVPFLNIPLRYIYTFEFPIIPVGESITCYGKYHVGFVQGRKDVLWEIGNIFDDDPDESNNEVTMVFRGAPAIIPAFSVFGLILLFILLMYLTYLMKFSKSHKFNLNRS